MRKLVIDNSKSSHGRLACLLMLLIAGCGHDQREKMWLGAFIGSQAADYHTTVRYLDIGGTEGNPLLDDHPNHEGVLAFKVGVIALVYTMGQVWPEHRTTFYKWGTLSGSTAAAWNDKQYEKFK